MYSPVIDRSEADFEVIVFIALVERQHEAPVRARGGGFGAAARKRRIGMFWKLGTGWS